MKENGVIRRRLSGKEADPYIGLGRKILGEMKNIMQMGGIKQLNWTKDLQNGVRIVVSSIFGQDEIRIFVPIITSMKNVEKISFDILGSELIVVGYSTASTGKTQAFRWTRADGMRGLGFLDGTNSSTATAISSDGETIVGYCNDVSGNTYGFYWTELTGMVSIGDIKDGEVLDVSGDGAVIVGYWYGSDSGLGSAFRWTQKTGIQQLPYEASHADDMWANAVSDDGKIVVGGCATEDRGDGRYESVGFRWTAETGTVSLGISTPAHATQNYESARNISADGSVIIGTEASGSNTGHLTVWTSATGNKKITEFSNVTASSNMGISDNGSQVGGTRISDGGGQMFKWNERDGMTMPYASFATCHNISEDGLFLVGATGQLHALLWSQQGGAIDLGFINDSDLQSVAYACAYKRSKQTITSE